MEKAKEAGATSSLLTSYEDALAIEKAKYNPKIKECKQTIAELLEMVDTGLENKTVETDVHKDFEARQINYLYKGEVVDSRNMTEDDMQTDMGA